MMWIPLFSTCQTDWPVPEGQSAGRSAARRPAIAWDSQT